MLELFTGTAGVPPAVSAQREQCSWKLSTRRDFSRLKALVAGEGARGPSEGLEWLTV